MSMSEFKGILETLPPDATLVFSQYDLVNMTPLEWPYYRVKEGVELLVKNKSGRYEVYTFGGGVIEEELTSYIKSNRLWMRYTGKPSEKQ